MLALVPFVFIVLYRFVDPPLSALMAWRAIGGAGIDYRWRDLDEIAPILPATVIMTEDARFCLHSGVDWGAVGDVWQSIEEGDAPRGASTIAMQTAKNLFLWPQRSYLRKTIEVPLAYWMDLVWGKRRTIEVYVNIAEWGPGVYGAEAAAQYHFGRPASGLTAWQAALLAASLPNPSERIAGRPGPLTRRLAGLAQRKGQAAGEWTGCLRD